ncbi:hypothetical protein MRX96_057632 [Rhipicephalus microplus]
MGLLKPAQGPSSSCLQPTDHHKAQPPKNHQAKSQLLKDQQAESQLLKNQPAKNGQSTKVTLIPKHKDPCKPRRDGKQCEQAK